MPAGKVVTRALPWKLRAGGDAPSVGKVAGQAAQDRTGPHRPGHRGLSRSDPDRFAFGVVNNALGGGMSSRLFQEIREKRGLVYSVFNHTMYAETGLFAAYAGTTPTRAKQVVGLIRDEVERSVLRA